MRGRGSRALYFLQLLYHIADWILYIFPSLNEYEWKNEVNDYRQELFVILYSHSAIAIRFDFSWDLLNRFTNGNDDDFFFIQFLFKIFHSIFCQRAIVVDLINQSINRIKNDNKFCIYIPDSLCKSIIIACGFILYCTLNLQVGVLVHLPKMTNGII